MFLVWARKANRISLEAQGNNKAISMEKFSYPRAWELGMSTEPVYENLFVNIYMCVCTGWLRVRGAAVVASARIRCH